MTIETLDNADDEKESFTTADCVATKIGSAQVSDAEPYNSPEIPIARERLSTALDAHQIFSRLCGGESISLRFDSKSSFASLRSHLSVLRKRQGVAGLMPDFSLNSKWNEKTRVGLFSLGPRPVVSKTYELVDNDEKIPTDLGKVEDA